MTPRDEALEAVLEARNRLLSGTPSWPPELLIARCRALLQPREAPLGAEALRARMVQAAALLVAACEVVLIRDALFGGESSPPAADPIRGA